MVKLNLEEKLKGVNYNQLETKIKENVVDFLLQFGQKEGASKTCKISKDAMERNVKVALRYIDPKALSPHAYFVAKQEIIDEILKMGESYVYYTKTAKEINGLEKHNSMQFEIYEIKLNEPFAFHKKNDGVYMHVVVEQEGASYARDIIKIEDDLYYAKQHLDRYDVIF